MSRVVAEALWRTVVDFHADLGDPKRVCALLSDLCGGEQRAAIRALGCAIESRSLAHAARQVATAPLAILLAREEAALRESHGLDARLARWAVAVVVVAHAKASRATQPTAEDLQCQIGLLYEAGHDADRAVEFFEFAAHQGHAEAQFHLGACHADGRGVVQDWHSAYNCFAAAAKQGNLGATHELAVCLNEGRGVVRDPATALTHFRHAAERGFLQSQYTLALHHLSDGPAQDAALAAAWLLKAAEGDLADAQYRLGMCYWHGTGLAKSQPAAVEWFSRAADAGHCGAQYKLACCYDQGLGVARDQDAALRWFEAAAHQGSAEAQYALGSCHAVGNSVLRDLVLAADWFRKSAAQGFALAQDELDRIAGRALADSSDAPGRGGAAASRTGDEARFEATSLLIGEPAAIRAVIREPGEAVSRGADFEVTVEVLAALLLTGGSQLVDVPSQGTFKARSEPVARVSPASAHDTLIPGTGVRGLVFGRSGPEEVMDAFGHDYESEWGGGGNYISSIYLDPVPLSRRANRTRPAIFDFEDGRLARITTNQWAADLLCTPGGTHVGSTRDEMLRDLGPPLHSHTVVTESDLFDVFLHTAGIELAVAHSTNRVYSIALIERLNMPPAEHLVLAAGVGIGPIVLGRSTPRDVLAVYGNDCRKCDFEGQIRSLSYDVLPSRWYASDRARNRLRPCEFEFEDGVLTKISAGPYNPLVRTQGGVGPGSPKAAMLREFGSPREIDRGETLDTYTYDSGIEFWVDHDDDTITSIYVFPGR